VTLLGRLFLFLSSYAFLFVLLVIRTIGDSWWATAIYAGLAGSGFAALGIVLWAVRSGVEREIEFREARQAGEATASYVVTYLIPFFDTNFASWRDVAVVVLFFSLLAFVYVQSEMLHLNPLLALFGYRMLEVTYATAGMGPGAQTRQARVFYRGALPDRHEPVRARSLGSNVYIAKM